MNIIFVIKALSIQGGGAERVLVEVASGLAQRGHNVTVVCNDKVETHSYYSLHPSVHQINLGIGAVGLKTNPLEAIRRMFAMRRVLIGLKPDVVIGFMHSTYITLGFALIGTGIRIIASEHTSIEHYKSRTFQRYLLGFTPFITKKITVVSEQIKLEFSPWLRRCMVAISNPVNFKIGKCANLVRCDNRPNILLSVGSLSVPKNQTCLINAFATIADTVPNWNLRIVGEGELRSALECQIRDLNLESRVQLPGAIKNISNEYLNAQLFVLPSSYESFGLATAEAIGHGLPVVGFVDCPGTNQLIQHNVNGLLVSGPDRINALANSLKSLMLSSEDRCRLGSASSDWLIEKFGINSVLDKWEGLLLEVTLINDLRVEKCVE